MKRYILLLGLMLISLISFSQKMTISGNVFDTLNKAPLKNSLATLVRVRDSVIVDFKRTDVNGDFSFETPIDTCYMVVNHPRFGERFYYFFGSVVNHDFSIGRIILPEKTNVIEEVVIYAYKDPVHYKGDTLVYIADSFATKPNAVVEDLLKKLPGITVETDGTLKSGGKQIDQVLVDGDEFFGSDHTIATKNLAATSIQSVQVYEKKDENSSDDETLQVLDLRLKDDAKNGYFGKVRGASDFNKYYETEALGNYFKGKLKVSAFALYSNTTRSNVNFNDMSAYGVSDGAGFSRYDDESDTWTGNSNDVGVGVPNVLRTGAYFNNQISEKTKLNINYTMNDLRLKSEGSRFSQYLLQDTTYFSNQESNSTTQNQSHKFKMRIDHKIDSLTTLIVEPSVNLSESINENNNNTGFLDRQKNRVRQNDIKNTSNSDELDFNSRVQLKKAFKKKNRNLDVQYRIAAENNKSNGNLYSSNIYDNSIQTNDTIDQLKNNNYKSLTNSATLTYMEPLNNKWRVGIDYEWFSNQNTQLKESFNSFNGNYSILDSTLTNNFKNHRMTNRVGGIVAFKTGKHDVNLGVRFRNTNMNSDNLFNNISINQNVNNVLPRLRYTYKFSMNSQLRINYTTTSTLPTINQLQPVLDNTNPNRRVIGNADLIPNFTHKTSVNYNTYSPLKGRYIFFTAQNSLIQNAFSNATTFNPDGSLTVQTINVNGNTNSFVGLYAGASFFEKKIDLRASLSYTNNRYNTLVNQQKNTTKENVISPELTVQFNLFGDSLNFVFSGKYNFQNTESTITNTSTIPFANQVYSGEIYWRMPGKFELEWKNTYNINNRLAQGYNLKYFISNVTLNRYFLKKENLIASVQVYDIFNQNINAQRTISSNVITDSKTFVIGRYFLLGLTYKFSSTGKNPQPNYYGH